MRQAGFGSGEERFRALVERAGLGPAHPRSRRVCEGVVILGPEGGVAGMNADALEMHGLGRDEPSAEAAPPDLDYYTLRGDPMPAEERPAARVARGERFTDVRAVVRNARTGDARFWAFSGSPVLGSDGRAELAVVTMRDVTEEHTAELERAELFHQLEAISRVSDVAIRGLDMDELLRRLLEELVEVTRADAGVVLLRRGERLVSAVAVGIEAEEEAGFSVGVDEGFSGRIATTGETSYVRDLDAGDGALSPFLPSHGLRSLLGVPLGIGDEVLGVLHVGWRRTRRFDARQARILELAADRCALAIRNAELREREHHALRLAEALNAMNRLLLSTLDVEEMLQRVVEEAAQAIGAEKGLLVRPRGDDWVMEHAYNLPSEVKGVVFSREAAPSVTAVATTGKPSLVHDVRHESASEVEMPESFGVRAHILVPLFVQAELVGIVGFAWSEPLTFSDEDLTFAERLSTAVSLALENARLYENERRVAHTLQESLLALPQRLAGMSFAHAYHSAAESARVGGDFYDVFELDHGHAGLVMGDVSGKGLEAAVLTSLVKNTLRAHAVERGKTPAEIVCMANEVVYRESGFSTFVTLFFGILDRRDGRLVYCNAGHPTAAVVRGDGTIVTLRSNSPLAGALLGARFQQSETCLEEGDLLFMYTDGLTEARDSGVMFGQDRLFDILARTRAEGPAGAVRSVLDEVLSFTGWRLSDDLAVLAVQRDETGLGPTQQKLPLM
ncbi:MAG: SpoIIE family protein phosphatase [Coriobacteriia bacterium]|nr:SpoIIE family protein phosphatase [Coriobacteriia bacterium]